MKNKRILILCLTLGLVALTGFGATLAYLTSNTETLHNKFTFSKGIDMQLDEDAVDPNTHVITEENSIIAGKEEKKGNTYDNVLPNEILPKDPTVTIKANSPECYVFVSVKNPSSDILTVNMNTMNWMEVGKESDTTYYVYIEANTNYPKVVDSKTADTRLEPVFETVTVKDVIEGENPEISDIVVKASAIQSKVGTENNYDTVKNEGLSLLGYKAN